MVKHVQNLLLHFSSMQFVPYSKRFSVHNFHGVEALRLLRLQPRHGCGGVPYLAKVHITYVTAAEAAQEAEMVESHSAFGAPEAPHGFPCSLVGLVRLVSLGGLRSGGGTDGDGAPAPAAEAEVAHPATARVGYGYGGRATVIVG